MKFRNDTGWTSVPNAIFEDRTLSPEGVRLIGWLFSHSGSFELRRNTMMTRLNLKDYSLRKAIGDAKSAGYLRTETYNCPKTGWLQSQYIVTTDSRFTTSGETTSISNNETTAFTSEQRAFLDVFPSKVANVEKFQNLFRKAIRQNCLEEVMRWAESYRLEVSKRSSGGRVSLPENYIWRMLNPEHDLVVEREAAAV